MENSTTPARQLDFQGLEGSGTEYFCFFRCLVSGLVWESFFIDFEVDLESILALKIDDKSK